MDMTYAFLKHLYGADDAVLSNTMNSIEYAPHTDADWDPFSIVHQVCSSSPPDVVKMLTSQVPGADPDAELESCVRPIGW